MHQTVKYEVISHKLKYLRRKMNKNNKIKKFGIGFTNIMSKWNRLKDLCKHKSLMISPKLLSNTFKPFN